MVKALVSAAAVTSAVRAQADRVHDAARRLGCTDAEATDVTTHAITALLDDLDHRPGDVRDLVGGLFARAWEPARRTRQSPTIALRSPTPPPDAPDSVLQSAAQSVAVHRALSSLPDLQRVAVLVRDSYGLDLEQTAVALLLDPPEAARTVALGRLALTATFDDENPISLAGHDVAVGDLGQLSDGSAPPSGRFAALRRHVSGCALCASVLFAQSRAHEMLSALPVLALPEQDRETLLRDAEQRAALLLPTAEEVRRRLEEGSSRRPLVPPVLVVGLIVVAILLGLGIGALAGGGSTNSDNAALTVTTAPTAHGSPSPGASRSTTPAPTPASSATATLTATPGNPSAQPPTAAPRPRPTPARPTTTPTTARARSTPTTSAAPTATSTRAASTRATPTPSPTASPTAPAATLSVSPTKGTYGSAVHVAGARFPPNATVFIRYVDQDGKPSGMPAAVTTNATGAFTATALVSDGTSSTSNDGPHFFVATAGSTTARAGFTQVPAS